MSYVSDSINSLQEKREKHLVSLKENGDNSRFILGEMLYSKKTHFIYELLQNAEDEGASFVNISFDSKSITFKHDGVPFEVEDFDAITTFGNNDKKKKKDNAIGRFGIGFKSVFGVTDSPEIKSGQIHIRITEYILPEIIDENDYPLTEIILPYKENRENIINQIEHTINEIDAKCLLFLNNITRIEIIDIIKNETYALTLKSKKYKSTPLTIYEIVDSRGFQLNYLIFTRFITIEKKRLKTKLAYKIKNINPKLILEEIDESPVYAFFSTEIQTNLPFLIHAPFLTTAGRDNIIENDYRNQKLFGSLCELMLESVESLKRANVLTLEMWKHFPFKDHYKSYIYLQFKESFSHYLKKKTTAIIPTDNKQFVHVNDGIIYEEKEFTNTIGMEDIKKYYNRKMWIKGEINNDEFTELYNYLTMDFNIPFVTINSFINKTEDNYFVKKSNAWLRIFYSYISDHTELWRKNINTVGPLRKKAFIRTSTNKTVKAFDNDGNLNVYLPPVSTNKYTFVNEIYLKDKNCIKLFKSLGITKPDLYSEVVEYIIPTIEKSGVVYPGFKTDLIKILKCYKNAENEQEVYLDKKLKTFAWLPVRSKSLSKAILLKPYEVYFPSPDLEEFFKTSKSVYFLDLSYFTEKKRVNRIDQESLKDLGCHFILRRYYIVTGITYYESIININNSWNNPQRELEGLDAFLKEKITKKSSLLLWGILKAGLLRWKSQGINKTSFIVKLRSAKWLYNKYGTLKSPSEMFESELDEMYKYDSVLIEALKFKDDQIKALELEYNGKFLTQEQYDEINERMNILEEELRKMKNKYEPDKKDEKETEIEFADFDFTAVKEIVLTANKQTKIENNEIQFFEIVENTVNPSGPFFQPITKRQIKIGKRGEEFAFELLKKKYTVNDDYEVVSLNTEDRNSIGCDFLITKNNINKYLIEIKTTEGGHESNFKISFQQWKKAIECHLNKKDVQYKLLCVYYAGTASPHYLEISDPVQFMLDGKLRFIDSTFLININ